MLVIVDRHVNRPILLRSVHARGGPKKWPNKHPIDGMGACKMTPSEAPARLRDFALCWKKHSLASTRFLEHLKTPTDGALSTQCLPSPSH